MDRSLIRDFGRRVRIGMVGGGIGSIIGDTHILALRADGFCELVAGALSSRPEVARRSAEQELIAPDRCYGSAEEMAEREAARPDRIDAVVIATPPQLHWPAAKIFLERGFDVICEKPMTRDLGEALAMRDKVRETGRLFCLTHCYTGFPMARQARALVRDGAIGAVTMIDASFSPGDVGTALEPADPADRHWRFRADSMGRAGILGEVNSHAYQMVTFVTGLEAQEVSALLSTLAKRREVYDNAYLTMRYPGNVVGRMWSSYVASGNDQGFSFTIYGEKGHLSWSEEDPEYLLLKPLGAPGIVHARGYDGNDPSALTNVRYRAGFPEGYGLAFANLYVDFAQAIMARALGRPYERYLEALPTVDDGVRGMKMIEAASASHENGGAWTPCAIA